MDHEELQKASCQLESSTNDLIPSVDKIRNVLQENYMLQQKIMSYVLREAKLESDNSNLKVRSLKVIRSRLLLIYLFFRKSMKT